MKLIDSGFSLMTRWIAKTTVLILTLFSIQSAMADSDSIATLGGGCFWCVEAVYERIDGVEKVVSGYAGGHVDNPTYRQVTSGRTGHAEVVQVYFDSETVSFSEIIDLFFRAHDPTTLNRQGADVGPQYRSIILYHDENQKMIAEERTNKAQKDFRDPIVTEIEALGEFYPAEDYHQNYYELNNNAGYCSYVIRPKLQKLGLETEPLKNPSDPK